MSQCLNPDCLTLNPTAHQSCQNCGKVLLLKDRYQALKLIGQGGFGKTFLAIDHDKPSKPRCVIKQFFPQQEGSEGMAKAEALFAAEAKRLEELGHHDQIPALFAHFTVEGRQYLVQEYVEGENLDEELKRLGTFNEAKIRQVLLDLLPVLDFIHQRQVIHRDIKPENIIRRAKDKKLVLVDFGAAKQVTSSNRSVTGTMIGTAQYIPPEQLNGKAVVASDLYSLGVTCLYLLTKISPFQLFDSGEFTWVWRDYIASNTICNEVGQILDKLISPGTKLRYQSAKEVLRDFGETEPTVKTNNSPNYSPNNVNQVSLKDLYSQLEALLQQRKWRKANKETCDILLTFKKKYTEWLSDEDIKKIPNDVFVNIDHLWSHYSQGHFGLKQQIKIYIETKKDYSLFCQRLGWKRTHTWLIGGYIDEYKLIFALNAPLGHLPFLIPINGTSPKEVGARMYWRELLYDRLIDNLLDE